MDKQNVKTKRRFLGKTEFVIDRTSPEKELASKQERHFYQRMLRAYLKGKEYFNFGREYNPVTKMYQPKQFKVEQEYYEG
jgi:hypothetical protein